MFVLCSNETTETVQSPKARKISFSFPVEPVASQSKHDSEGQIAGIDPSMLAKELTCISEEGLIDMDFQVFFFKSIIYIEIISPRTLHLKHVSLFYFIWKKYEYIFAIGLMVNVEWDTCIFSWTCIMHLKSYVKQETSLNDILQKVAKDISILCMIFFA